MTTSTMTYFTAALEKRLGAVLAGEAPDGISRESATLLAGAGDLILGTVLGARLFGGLTLAAAATNTGNGAIASAALGVAAKVGTYTLTCVAAAANGGRFQVVDPDGYRLGDALVGTAYAGALSFTVGDGTTDWAVGDVLTLTIAAGDGKLVPLAPGAVDGTARAAAILLQNVSVGTTDATAQVLVRLATVIETGLIWPDAITDTAKAAALSRLGQAHILTRTSA